MKKFILTLLFTFICGFGYSQLKHILCDCHDNFYNCIPSYYSNDTVIYYTMYTIYNDIESEQYGEYHYKKTNINSLTDSIEPINKDILNGAEDMYECFNFLVLDNEISKKFKYGFIDDWSWSLNSVNGIDLNIKYTNTNSKIIKYIDIYFYVKNPVDDICKILYNDRSNICHVKCVGPIYQYDSASYKFDAVCYTTGDAKYLYFTKFVITYMDNTKYTLVKELAYKKYYTK